MLPLTDSHQACPFHGICPVSRGGSPPGGCLAAAGCCCRAQRGICSGWPSLWLWVSLTSPHRRAWRRHAALTPASPERKQTGPGGFPRTAGMKTMRWRGCTRSSVDQTPDLASPQEFALRVGRRPRPRWACRRGGARVGAPARPASPPSAPAAPPPAAPSPVASPPGKADAPPPTAARTGSRTRLCPGGPDHKSYRRSPTMLCHSGGVSSVSQRWEGSRPSGAAQEHLVTEDGQHPVRQPWKSWLCLDHWNLERKYRNQLGMWLMHHLKNDIMKDNYRSTNQMMTICNIY